MQKPTPIALTRPQHLALAAVALVQFFLGLALLPEFIFMKYPAAAALARAGQLDAARATDFSPLYLLLNMAVAPQPLRLLQAAAAALAVFAVGQLAARLGSFRSGLLASLLLSGCGSVHLYASILEPDTLISSFSAIAVSLAAAREPRLPRVAAAGLLAGLAQALRPTSLVLTALLLLFLALEAGQRRLKVGLAFVLGVALGVGVPLGLVRTRFAPEALATMSAGQVFHMGHRPELQGLGATYLAVAKLVEAQYRGSEHPDYSHAVYRTLAQADAGKPLSPAQCEERWRQRAWDYLEAYPSAAVRLPTSKLLFTFFGPELHDLPNADRAELDLPPLLGLGLLGPLAIAAALARRLRSRETLLLWGYLAVPVGPMVLFYTSARYGVTLLPPLAVSAALLAAPSGFSARRLLVAAGAVAAVWSAMYLAGPLASARAAVEASRRSVRHLEALENAADERDYAAATQALKGLDATWPFWADSASLRGVPLESPSVRSAARAQVGGDGLAGRWLLANLALQEGDCQTVLQLAEKSSLEWADWDRLVSTRFLAARCLARRGELAQANARLEAMLAQRPGTLEGLALLAAAQRGLSLPSTAERELYALHDRTSADLALSRALREVGRPADALQVSDRALSRVAEAAALHLERAYALAALRRDSEALEALRETVRRFPRWGFAVRPFVEVTERARQTEPDSALVHWAEVELLIRRGRFADAEAALATGADSLASDKDVTEQKRFLEAAVRRPDPADAW